MRVVGNTFKVGRGDKQEHTRLFVLYGKRLIRVFYKHKKGRKSQLLYF